MLQFCRIGRVLSKIGACRDADIDKMRFAACIPAFVRPDLFVLGNKRKALCIGHLARGHDKEGESGTRPDASGKRRRYSLYMLDHARRVVHSYDT